MQVHMNPPPPVTKFQDEILYLLTNNLTKDCKFLYNQ